MIFKEEKTNLQILEADLQSPSPIFLEISF
jgi:hypothetical protein